MTLVATDAIVLHAFDYRETSRIFRLATRDAGVVSVMARGARRPKSRYGSAMDLFAEGSAQIVMHGTRDLHTLAAFDVVRARPDLASTWARFAAASALSEILLRFARDDAQPGLYEAYATALSALQASDESSAVVGIAGAWTLVAELGFAPSLDACASCGTPLDDDAPARFAHRAGGAMCVRCGAKLAGSREIPGAARAAIAAWIAGTPVRIDNDRTVLSHLRLLREFLHEHLADHKPLRAFAVWERGDWLPR